MSSRNPTGTASRATAAESARALLKMELSAAARFGYVALLLAALTMSVGLGSLWATEPSLPMRTHVALGTMVAIGLSWVAYAAWVLTTRRVLLGRHRVVAGRMAVAFTALFLAFSLTVLTVWDTPAAAPAAGLGAVMFGVALWLLMRARRHVRRLTARRADLERTLRT